MELPFAVENEPASTYLPTSSPTYQNVSSLHHKSSSQHSHSSATTRTSLTSSNGQHRGEDANIGAQTAAASANLLHRVALYDNVHPDFYTPQNIPLPTSHQHHALKSHMHAHQHHQQHHQSIVEDDFVTIDAEDDITVQTTSSGTSYHYPPPTTVVPPSRSSKNHSLSVSKTSVAYGNQTDVLALLLSSVTAPSPLGEGKVHDEEDPSNGHVSYKQGSNSMMDLCQRAAESASSAARATREGHIDQAVKYHLEASKCYRDAALLLKREHKGENGSRGNVGGESAGSTWGVDVKILAYSLLMSSNSQARNADCLIKSGSVNLGEIVKITGGKKGTGGSNDKGGGSGGNEGKQTSGKEDRLRAKIRASMDTAEADMTDSTFLGRATGHPQPATVHMPQEANAAGSNAQEKVQPSMDSSAVGSKKASNAVNPVDDMMALEQELRNMDATLNMGVNLSSSTSSIATKKTTFDGSFCVVPGSGASTGGSSFISSSMMWGGRNAHTNGHAHGNGRARANRVQTILGASSAGMHKSPSVGNHQQLHQPHHFTNNIQNTKHHPGLESSWWGQASALASSTTSLSNSMVGVRSANIGANHIHPNGAAASPTNTKQLMRLLDSLKTLGDENASLLKEVDDAKKARLEAKAARETMKTFQEEYNNKFNLLRAALSEFRAMYPDQKGRPGNNIVSKSNYVKASTAEKHASAELQKRDQMIQKLNADLMAEKAESKKKDDSLRKYESFYKEVKARSEQKKRQQQEEERRRRN